MYPTIFGFIDSYVLMILVGVAAAFVLLIVYFKKKKLLKIQIIDTLICAIVAIISGIIFSCLFQNLYDFIESPSTYKWTWAMTFYGGLLGGVIGFLLMYFLWYRKHNKGIMKKLLTIAPACITIAHAFGRIGCFLAGCCYGKQTTSWIGIKFPDHPNPIIPTQLIESVALFILTFILIILAFRFECKYTFVVYMLGYAIIRFIIEFYRDDHRGAFLGIFSPSQIWCFVLFISGFVMWFLLKKVLFRNEEKSN